MLSRLKFEIKPLVNEILDRLPADLWVRDDVTFLDPAMAGGQFITEIYKRLISAGHSWDNIASRVYGLADSPLSLNFITNKYKISGQFSVGGVETMEQWMTEGKKFDVVIGNPPYQKTFDGERKAKKYNLWSSFVEQALQLSDTIALVIPDGWMTMSNPTGQLLLQHHLTDINAGECGKHFPGVGARFTYVVVQNSIAAANCTIQTNDDTFSVDIKSIPFLPARVSEHALTILKKVVVDPVSKLSISRGKGYHTSNKQLFGEESAVYSYPIHHTNAQTLYSNYAHVQLSTKKVIFTLSGYYKPVYDFTGCFGASQCTAVYELKDTDSAAGVESVFSSNLFRFLITELGFQGGWISLEMSKNLPAVDLTRTWTDAELYAHFKLTQEEIDLIEATVK